MSTERKPPWGPKADRQVHQMLYHLILADRRRREAEAREERKDGTNG